MLHFDSNIPSNIYYAFIGCEILRFARTTSNRNNFIILANQLLERIQKQGIKHKFIIAKLKKIFGEHFNVFNVLADTADNFTKLS